MSTADRSRVSDLITRAWSTQAIHAAVTLGVIDAVSEAGSHAAVIAQSLGLHPRATFRLLRALAGLGLVEHRGGDLFAPTEAGRLLRSDAPDSLSILARHWGGRTWAALTQLDETVRTGKAFKDSGREGFLAMKDKPELARVFNLSMVRQTRAVARAIVEAYDFSAAREVIDLGGGYGALLAAVLKANPHLQGASADLGYMQSEAEAFLKEEGVADRARFAPTDFFAAVPLGADFYLLKFIIHDWDDAESIAILANTAKAAGASGKVLVVERLVPEIVSGHAAGVTEEKTAALRGDIQMMASTGGQERTEAEYDALFAAAGLRRLRTVPTTSVFSILEAVAR
jgi:hypothetical protein